MNVIREGGCFTKKVVACDAGDQEAVDQFWREVLSSQDECMRAAATLKIFSRKDPDRMADLKRMAEDPSVKVRCAALDVFAALNDPSSLLYLRRAVWDKSPTVRHIAIQKLRKLGSRHHGT